MVSIPMAHKLKWEVEDLVAHALMLNDRLIDWRTVLYLTNSQPPTPPIKAKPQKLAGGIHPPTYLPTKRWTNWRNDSLTHLSIHPPSHSLTHSLSHPLTYSPVGRTEEQRATVDMLLDQVMDMRNAFVTLVYSRRGFVRHSSCRWWWN